MFKGITINWSNVIDMGNWAGGGARLGRRTIEEFHSVDDYMAEIGLKKPERSGDYYENIGPATAAAQMALATIMVILVSIRLFHRRFIIKSVGLDDWCIIASTLSSLGMVTVHSLLVFKYGAGMRFERYVAEFGLQLTGIKMLKLIYISLVFHTIAMLTIKCSVLYFLRRFVIFGKHRLSLNILTAVVIPLSSAWVFITVFQCSPISSYWNFRVPGSSTCIPGIEFILNRVIPTTNAMMDILIWGLPIPVVVTSKIPLKRRIAIVSLFLIGAGALSASLARVFIYNKHQLITDPSYTTAKLSLVSAMEPLFAIITASLFTLGPLWKHIRGKTSASREVSPEMSANYDYEGLELGGPGNHDSMSSDTNCVFATAPLSNEDFQSSDGIISPPPKALKISQTFFHNDSMETMVNRDSDNSAVHKKI